MPLANEFDQLFREKLLKQIDIMDLKEVFFDGSGSLAEPNNMINSDI
jgi:hypothetical protein